MDGPVLFWVQHLLGSGHLKRVARIASVLAESGTESVIASGGMPVATLDTGRARLVQLSPVRAGDEGFSTLVDGAGQQVGAACLDDRRRCLESLVRRLGARLVVTETWPFGRRQFTPEVLGLIGAARRVRPDTVVVSSVRDILQQPSRPERHDAMRDLAQQHCNHVMVHGVESFVPFGETFRHAGALSHRLVYTGYVADVPSAVSDRGPGRDEIVVSAGGGAVGRGLFEAAMAAPPYSKRACRRRWRLLVGDSGVAPCEHQGMVIEANRPDFPDLLRRCAVSVSQAGYNTVAELLGARARAVVAPWSGAGETEQKERAKHLQRRRLAVVLDDAALTPRGIARAVDEAFDLEAGDLEDISLDGARESARLVREWQRHG
ncbi:MAG: glycosyltransferase [bacterium]|nr:glycosyltransferase [bacterium]